MSAIAAIASRSLFVAPGVSTPPSAPFRSMYPVAKRGGTILQNRPNPLPRFSTVIKSNLQP